MLVLLAAVATGARAAWTGGTYTATANENLGAITVTGGINITSGTLTVTGPGTLVVTGAKGNDGWFDDDNGLSYPGGNGGAAISGNIIVQGGATVTATGGNGGGGMGGDADPGKAFANSTSVSFQTNGYILTSNGSAIGYIGGQKQITIAPAPVAVTGVTLPATATVTLGDPVALTAAVAPADATDKKVKWTVTAGTDKVKLYKDAECKTEVGTDATDVLTVYVKGLAVGEATVKVESNEDETKTATCAVTAKHGTYAVAMKAGVTDGDQWTARAGGSGAFAAMPLKGVEGGTKPVELKYAGDRVVKRVTATVTPKWKGDLTKILAADLESDGTTLTVENGTTLTGELAENYRVVIADGATVTLDGVTINGANDNNFQWAGLTCLGDATIMLKDGSVNTVKGFHENYPGICVPVGKTLTIDGPGKLTASSNGKGAGIGGGYAIGCGNITIAATVGKVKGVKGADAPNSIGAGGQATCGTVTIGGTIYYDGSDYQNGGDTYLTAEKTVYPAGNTIVLNDLTGDTELQDGDVVTGTLDGNYIITIADGAEVTLNDVTIDGTDEWGEAYNHAGITCLGDATINLKSETNYVKGFYSSYAGIQAGPTGKKLIIKGTGALTASSNGSASGIGASKELACGDIEIQGGHIFANGGASSAGIGGSYKANCGKITISGGNIDAKGPSDNDYDGPGIGSGNFAVCGDINISGGTIKAKSTGRAAGIGSSYGNNQTGHSVCGNITITGGNVEATGADGAGIGTANVGNSYAGCTACGNITIANTVERVKAIKSDEADHSIGKGKNGSCGTVTIGGTVYWQNNAAQNGGGTYLTGSPLIYPDLQN